MTCPGAVVGESPGAAWDADAWSQTKGRLGYIPESTKYLPIYRKVPKAHRRKCQFRLCSDRETYRVGTENTKLPPRILILYDPPMSVPRESNVHLAVPSAA